MAFAHLHLHTEYSLLDGACRIGPLLDRVAELGQSAVAITDHGVMYGVVDFHREAKKRGIKPIIGCEVYVANRSRFDKVHRLDYNHHLVLLCENNTGYQNLIKLVSAGFTEGFYSKPRVDKELLRAHSEGLIASSACLSGEVSRKLADGDYDGAKAAALEYREIFGTDNFFLELQDHGIEEQRRILPLLYRIAEETGIPVIAANDCHYILKEDSRAQNILVCIQTNRTVEDGSDMEFSTEEFYVKSEDEMRALFPGRADAVENTMRIAERCNVEFEFGVVKLPNFSVGDGIDNAEYFRRLCFEGLHNIFGERPDPAYINRMEFELNVIDSMGFTDYFLIVHDFIRHAKEIGIPVGPGRGSGAASLCAYCVGITGIDPIKYQLLFERFLNPERVSMPDFDIDFCYERRQEVIDYVVERYGADHVAQIITFGTMAARGSLRDVGRALAVPYQTVDRIAKMVPMELGMTLERALKVSPELKLTCDGDLRLRELMDMARKLEGMPRHSSTHAAGVVITREPVDHYVPVQTSDEAVVTQFPMTTIEDLGLLKIDFLGLRTLTVIHDAEQLARQRDPEFSIEKIPEDDPAVFEMLTLGNTQGVFQFESAGMRNVLTGLRSTSLEDLIAVISLYRPGPMDSIDTYIRNRHNPELVRYKTPLLKPILDVTYGCIIYQEQVMQICRELAGFSYGRADLVRRAMAKKKASVMEKERESFIYGAKNPDGSVSCVGAVANGVSEAVANEIFDEMSGFASYAFNKAHAAAYALLSYRTAYLKAHYPPEFMAALLTSCLENTHKVIEYTAECARLGIRVLPPTIHDSAEGFTVEDGAIRFGLLALKNLGRGPIRQIIFERAKAPFANFFDFCERMHGKDFNRRTLEALIKSGALNVFGNPRKQMMENFEAILDSIEAERKSVVEGQVSLFQDELLFSAANSFRMPYTEEYTLSERLLFEKETTGLYLSGHPLEAFRELAQTIGAADIASLLPDENDPEPLKNDGKMVKLLAVIQGKSTKNTKNGDMMAFATLEDMTGSMDAVVFPKILTDCGHLLVSGQIVALYGRVSIREDEPPKLVCERIVDVQDAESLSLEAAPPPRARRGFTPRTEEVPPETAAPVPETSSGRSKRPGLYLKIPRMDGRDFDRMQSLLSVFDGTVPVYLYVEETEKLIRAPQSLWVEPNDVLLSELRRQLGDKNAVLVT